MSRKFEGSGITIAPMVKNGVSGFFIEMPFQNLSADPGISYTFISESDALNLVDFILKTAWTPKEVKEESVITSWNQRWCGQSQPHDQHTWAYSDNLYMCCSGHR